LNLLWLVKEPLAFAHAEDQGMLPLSFSEGWLHAPDIDAMDSARSSIRPKALKRIISEKKWKYEQHICRCSSLTEAKAM